MAHANIVIATITWSRHGQESDHLRRSLDRLVEYGLPVVVADGGSEPGFLAYLQQLPGISLSAFEPTPPGGLMGQIKRSLAGALALAPGAILYTEPDKLEFFERHLPTFLDLAAAGPLGVTVAARDEVSLATFPGFQQYTETVGNDLCAELLGQAGDFFYGPLLLNPALVPYLAGVTENLGWGWRPFIMVVAHRLGLPVQLVTLDLPCPLEQRDEDNPTSRLYRMEQLAQNARGLVLGARLPLPDPHSPDEKVAE